jgi:hypothetical protein
VPDDLRVRRSPTTPPAAPTAIVASAQVLSEQRLPIPEPARWQADAWGFYETTPEVRFAAGWLENALGRCRIYAARSGADGDEPVRIETPEPDATEDRGQGDEPVPLTAIEQAANDLVSQFAGGTTGQAEVLSTAAIHLTVPGEGYLVGEPSGNEEVAEGPDTWNIYSAEEVKSEGTEFDRRYILTTGDSTRDKRTLPDDALVVRLWRRDRRRHWQADSPIRATLGVLRELAMLTERVQADIVSRLAGNGLLLLPDEMTFPVSEANAEAEDPFLAEFMDAMIVPIQDRSAASAVVPFVVRMKGDVIPNVQHITFSTPLDDRALALREEAIKRFAAGMDLPAEVVLGLGESNHWSAWQIEESALKLHVEPMLEAICQGLTDGYLRPALRALGFAEEQVAALIVWFDASDLVARPNRAADAREAYRDGVIGSVAYLREIGMSPDDAPTDDELKRKVILDVIAGLPSAAPMLLPALGIDLDLDTAAQTIPTPDNPEAPQVPEEPVEDGPVTRGPPPTPEAVPGPQEAALVASADGVVWRALERAGARLSGLTRKAGGIDHGCPHAMLHTCVPEEIRMANLDALLAGAWDRVPEVAARHDMDPLGLTETLDSYVRTLVVEGWPHDYDRLAGVLGAA